MGKISIPFKPTFGAGAPGVNVPTSQPYFNTSTTPYTMYVYNGGAWRVVGDPTGTGTVTSVALAATPSSIFDVSGSPVTGAGTLTLGMDNQNANLLLAGPSSGGAAQPAFRSMVNADFPTNPTFQGNTTFVPTGVTNAPSIGKGSGGAYGFFSLNASYDLSTGLGIFGGDVGDPATLYLTSPTNISQRINGVDVGFFTGLISTYIVPVRTGIYTVVTLPVAPGDGARAYVTDALAPVALTAVVGGGAIRVPVYYDAGNAAWYVG